MHKGHTYPECTCEEGDHTAPESWLLSLWSDTLVNTLSKPNIGLHVPGIEKNFEIRWELDFHDSDIGGTIPGALPGSIESRESQSSDNTSTL